MTTPIHINLLPAIVVAGPPHSGKSVLNFLLTARLKALGVPHYLLRAVPDGEGNWFLQGPQDRVWEMRINHKTGYSEAFVRHMLRVLQRRTLPLLVDIGGKPSGTQLKLLDSCTHCILLYKTAQEKTEWQTLLRTMNLLPIALLRSDLEGEDVLEEQAGVLGGVIAGLDRQPERRRSGPVFDALLERVGGIFAYSDAALESWHCTQAPLPVLQERLLADWLGLSPVGTHWLPQNLAQLPLAELRNATGWALYGRGPVWLAAALAAQTSPQPLMVFDVRLGWVDCAALGGRRRTGGLRYQLLERTDGGLRVEVSLPDGMLEAEQFFFPRLPQPLPGVLLSGKLPRWAFAALARRLVQRGVPWLAVQDMNVGRAVLVFSRNPAHVVGEMLD